MTGRKWKYALQYPHTGRTSCIANRDSGTLRRRWNCSTLTRVELHASAGDAPASEHCPHHCSTLTRVELHASCSIGSLSVSQRYIAVPSHGSNFMHPFPLFTLLKKLYILQYPHTGRTSCIAGGEECGGLCGHIAVPSHGSNFMHPTHGLRRPGGHGIAVPSHGSNFMHPFYHSLYRLAKRNCSTLTRVELHASHARRRFRRDW